MAGVATALDCTMAPAKKRSERNIVVREGEYTTVENLCQMSHDYQSRSSSSSLHPKVLYGRVERSWNVSFQMISIGVFKGKLRLLAYIIPLQNGWKGCHARADHLSHRDSGNVTDLSTIRELLGACRQRWRPDTQNWVYRQGVSALEGQHLKRTNSQSDDDDK